MGMGYGSNYADVVEDRFIEKICPKEWKKFIDAISKNEEFENMEEFAQVISYDDVGEDEATLAYNSLVTAFNNETKLDLSLGYHDCDENGDRYDDINGCFWRVDGVYQLTPAGMKYKNEIDRKFFVTFG